MGNNNATSKFPVDKLTVIHIPRGPHAPSISPFSMKFETYLRMAEIPYENFFSYSHFSPKGKIPWMCYQGKDVGDSQLCIELLNKDKVLDLSSHLTSDQRAVARSFRLMLEDNMFWILVMYRFKYGVIDKHLYDWHLNVGFAGAGRLFLYVISRRLVAQAHANGVGRHSHEEILEMGHKNLQALSAFLGEKSFLMGEQPCEEDAAMFAFMAAMYYNLPGSPYQNWVKELKNLEDYVLRMQEKYWPDWDECITHGNTKPATK